MLTSTTCLICRNTRAASHEAVDVPDGVIDLLTDLRNWLQDKAEPPIYISDRRFMKSIQLLQVAAFADGRDEVGTLSQACSSTDNYVHTYTWLIYMQ